MEYFEVCLCNKVMQSTIVKAIHENGFTTLKEVQYATKAGTISGGCITDIEELLINRNNQAMKKSNNKKLSG